MRGCVEGVVVKVEGGLGEECEVVGRSGIRYWGLC